MSIWNIVAYGAQDVYITGSNASIKTYSLIKECLINGFKIKNMVGWNINHEYAKSKNKFSLQNITNIFSNDSLIYLSDDLDNLSNYV
uniref:Uncharacterized protein n=1 Tax=viral metagenome TaxID=1070528 RepID=A0A6C0E5T9_9ZZZZ